jgi:uncharacterized protein DUF3990
MSTLPLLLPPPSWTNQWIRLCHGTSTPAATAITTSGVLVSTGRPGTDFGPGFYTTTLERQARFWAWQLWARRVTGGPAGAASLAPAVVYADIDRDALAGLDCLAFVRGDFDADDFWSLVVHCRTGGMDHARGSAGKTKYDVVVGPVAAMWQQRTIIAGADQMSFHTPRAQAVLNRISWSLLP